MSTEQATVEQHEQWLEEPAEPELPRRPRRRLLTPIPLALTGVLLIACGFIGGVLVEKGQSSSGSSSGAAGFASRFASLRAGGGSGARAGGSGTSAGGTGTGSGGRAASLFGAGAGGAGGTSGAGGFGATVGQVAYVSGSTLYVTSAEGNTVKVKTSDSSTVSKTVKSDVKGIHPGETVIVTGNPSSGGAVQAESIRVSEAGASGGLSALFGGGPRGGSGSRGNAASSSGGATGSGGGTSGTGGEPALFGK
jgi:hypothetical protein